MTKINVTQELTNIMTGEPIQMPSATCEECGRVTEGQPFTLRLACTKALMEYIPQENSDGKEPKPKKLSGIKNIQRFSLALRIYNEDSPSLSAEEIGELKKVIEGFYVGPGVVGQALLMLDPPD